MRHLFLIAGAWMACLVWSPQALAEPSVDPAAVVKIRSVAPDPAVPRVGSGILFKHKDRVFVLTSDHVIYRGGNPYRHEVSNETFGALPANYIFADWGRALALLQLSPEAERRLSADSRIPQFDQLRSIKEIDPFDPPPVRVLGYPANSQTLINYPAGHAGYISVMDFVISLRHMGILSKSYAEFGMSGGPVFLESGEFFGILSHLLFLPDENTAREWDAQDYPSRWFTLILPFDDLRSFLADYLEKNSLSDWQFYQPEDPVPRDHTLLRTSHLQFDIETDPMRGSVSMVKVSYLDAPATQGLYHFGAFSYFEELQALLAAIPEPDKRAGIFTGARIELTFRYLSFADLACGTFHMYTKAIHGGNVEALFLLRSPEPELLRSTLTRFLATIKELEAKPEELTDYHRGRLMELRIAFSESLRNPRSLAWTVARPEGIKAALTWDPTPPLKNFYTELHAFMNAYVY